MSDIEKQLAETRLELKLMCYENNLLEREVEKLKKLLNDVHKRRMERCR